MSIRNLLRGSLIMLTLALSACGGGSAGGGGTSQTPQPATISGLPATQVVAGSAYAFTPTVSNPGGGALTFSIQNPPSWATFNTTTGELSGTPTSANVGTYPNILLSVTNGTLPTATLAAFTITVTAAAGNTTYPIRYDGNGNTGGTAPTDANQYPSGAAVTVLGNPGNLVRTGYSFSGWNTAADGSGTQYAAANTFSMGTAAVTLYAQWSAVGTPVPGPYAAWSNFPQSPTFFPLSVWNQNPAVAFAAGSTYPTVATAMKNLNMTVLFTVDGGVNGYGYPAVFGQDTLGDAQAIVDQGIYLILQISDQTARDYGSTTAATSVPSLLATMASINASSSLIGYQIYDEPQTGTCNWVSSIPTWVSLIGALDNTRPTFANHTDWVANSGVCAGNVAALQAVGIGSFDEYPLISPWVVGAGGGHVPADTMWIQGWSVNQFVANARAGEPIWAYVETGTDALGFSAQNSSTCNAVTNLCSPGNNEYRATAEQVNAEVWMTLINGAIGIEYFCDDTISESFCLGNNSGHADQAAAANAIAANLASINATIQSYAAMLNSPVTARCTMNTGLSYTSFSTLCTNGILTMSTGNASVPGSALLHVYGGAAYLIADSDRTGSTALSFTLTGYAGKAATVVYDSNARYDSAHSSVGTTITLDASGKFSDTFGANGHDYQPKIYKIQ